MTPEQKARVSIDALLVAAGWHVCDVANAFSVLKGKEQVEDADEESTTGLESLLKQFEPIGYNPTIPIESFDIVVTDEARRSIYSLWRQVLECFETYLIGLAATPNKQTFGFFYQNLVMEYGHAQAVADGLNVNYDVYRIKAEVTEQGAKVDTKFERARALRHAKFQKALDR